MRKDTPDDVTSLELLAEMRAMIDAARQVIEGSKVTRVGPVGESAAAPVSTHGADAPHDPADLLGDISDSLLDAYQFAKHDGDPLTIALIEKVLFHVGRRLARGMTPAEAGIPCH